VVNPEYSNNAYYLKKIREKIVAEWLHFLNSGRYLNDIRYDSYLKKQLSIKEELMIEESGKYIN